MSRATHTPGPWAVERPYGEPGMYVAAPSSALVCKLYPVDGRYVADQLESVEANARLIAAAPELLAALRGLFEHCAMVHKQWGEGSNAREAEAAEDAARAALAKAEGRDA